MHFWLELAWLLELFVRYDNNKSENFQTTAKDPKKLFQLFWELKIFMAIFGLDSIIQMSYDIIKTTQWDQIYG